MRYRAVALALWAAVVWVGAGPVAVEGQVVSGVVVDGVDGGPIEGVLVSLLVEEERVRSTTTDGAGRFELELRDRDRFELRFERVGYTAQVLSGRSGVPSRETLEVELTPDPFVLSGIGVDTEREREQFRLSDRYIWSEDGLYRWGGMHLGCKLMVLDSVVIRDPDMYRPEVIEEYWPASQLMGTDGGRGATTNALGRPQVLNEWMGYDLREPRLEREAAPCSPAVLLLGQDPYYDRLHRERYVNPLRPRPDPYPERPPPEPDAAVVELVPSVEVEVAAEPWEGAPFTEAKAALGPEGRLAVAVPGEGVVRVLDREGREARVWRLSEGPTGLEAITHLGWSADTLWAADAWRGRVAFMGPGDEVPRVREPNAPQLVSGEVDGAPYEGEDPDLEVPLPLADGRWLSVQLTHPEPYPVRMDGEPARRALVVLSPEERTERVLGFLRPGPWRVDVKEPEAPLDPFRDYPLYAVSPEGRHVTVVERSLERAVWMDIYTVTRMTLEGDTVFRVERPPALIRPSEATRGRVARELSEHPVIAEALPSPEVRPILLEGGLLYEAPFHPPISEVVVGRDGTTWLRWPEEGGGPVRWDVLDPTGSPLRTLTLEPRVQIRGATADGVWALVPAPGEAGGLHAIWFEILERR